LQEVQHDKGGEIMSEENIKQIAKDNIKNLDEKKDQTTYKIKYVGSYVGKWLLVMVNAEKIKTINFIDCMCNAGIYKDGDLGTAIEVLKLFKGQAFAHTDKTFNILLNDNDNNRIEIIKKVANEVIGTKPSNLNIIYSVSDVNTFLENTDNIKKYYSDFNTGMLLFVDPYNFGTVKLQSLKTFTQKYYCELLWNVFTSDYNRNINTDENNTKIIECMGGKEKAKGISTIEQLVAFIRQELVQGNIKHTFAYEFHITNNVELYQIIYFTPHLKGLEKLKEALWDTFNGKQFHRNKKEQTGIKQLSLITYEVDKDMSLNEYRRYAKEILISKFGDKEIKYSDIEIYLLENTMLGAAHIIENVLKPLIAENKVVKQNKNIKRTSNYKNDTYLIKGGIK
jgi:three-Cys-motif partner protein